MTAFSLSFSKCLERVETLLTVLITRGNKNLATSIKVFVLGLYQGCMFPRMIEKNLFYINYLSKTTIGTRVVLPRTLSPWNLQDPIIIYGLYPHNIHFLQPTLISVLQKHFFFLWVAFSNLLASHQKGSASEKVQAQAALRQRRSTDCLKGR